MKFNSYRFHHRVLDTVIGKGAARPAEWLDMKEFQFPGRYGVGWGGGGIPRSDSSKPSLAAAMMYKRYLIGP